MHACDFSVACVACGWIMMKMKWDEIPGGGRSFSSFEVELNRQRC